MNLIRTRLLRSVPLVIVVLAVAGCPARSRVAQLENVAKDWSLLVRASQIIPVYPLTEDLQPGDIFLVETPIQRQAKEYEASGFLRLDQHMGRLADLQFDDYYKSPLGVGSDRTRPGAAFPTYEFSVKSGKGLNLALPVQGVPVGLSIMKTDSANGALTIADASTYGLPLEKLDDGVRSWAALPANFVRLDGIRRSAAGPVYLRVISRVFASSRVVISMTNASTGGADLQAGAPVEMQPLDVGTDAAASYSNAIESINATVSKALPGGHLRVVQASSRSVSMSETFSRPLVIGYVGFDFRLTDAGTLGPPLATRTSLSEQIGAPATAALTDREEEYVLVDRAIRSLDDDRQELIYAETAATLGSDFATAYKMHRDTAGTTPRDAFSEAKTRYLIGKTDVDSYLAAMTRALRTSWSRHWR